ncbi:MAG: hypothetical protein GEU90_05215 [Gemmatimonas sp.]|nr:hypothetical protein [Gemmatimonas sp.]
MCLLRGHSGFLGTALGFVAVVVLAGCSDSEARSTPPLDRATLAETGASNPTVAVSPAGLTYVAWAATEGDESNVLFSRTVADGTFSEVVRVNHIAGDAAPHAQAPAQVAAGPGDEIYVVWQNRSEAEWLDFGASDVRFSRSLDGGETWFPAVTVNDNDPSIPARNTFHDVEVADDGTIYVSWIDARVRDGFRGDYYRETGESPPVDEEPATEIRLTSSKDGGATFTPSVVLETNSCPCCRTSMATGPDGMVYVSYRKVYGDNIRDIAVVRSLDGGRTFEEPVRVHDDGWYIEGCPHAGASLAVDRDGRVHVAWFTGAQDHPGAFYAVSEDQGRSFEEPVRLTPPGAVPTTQVAVAADDAGTVWVAWEETDGAQARVALARTQNGDGLERVELGGPTGLIPAVAAANPEMALAWLDGEAVRLVRTAATE